ncbi:MAG: hypothetical protein HUU37_08395 [Bdellovibrionales bacterium]|nr:hypothetical protein [Bdellovibrionales bacterium]
MELTALSRVDVRDGWIRVRGPSGAANLLRLREARRIAEESGAAAFEWPAWELHEDVIRKLRRRGVPVSPDGAVPHLSPMSWSFANERDPENLPRLARALATMGVSMEGVAVPDDLLPFAERYAQRLAHLEPQALLEALDLLTCYRDEGFAILVRPPPVHAFRCESSFGATRRNC